MMGSMDWIDLA